MTFLLALGLVLSPSTELRIGGAPFGPGEFLLVLWLGLIVADTLLNRAIEPNPAILRILAFWTVTGLALSIGMIAGLLREPYHYLEGMAHDTGAYALMLALGSMIALDLGDAERRARTIRLVVLLGAASSLIQVASGAGLVHVPGTDPWYFDRLRGWSLDPNQLGFQSVFVILLALHLAETATGPGRAVAWLACAAPSIVAGLQSDSDTFRVVMILAAVPYVVLKSMAWMADAELAPTLRGGAVVFGVLAAPAAIGASLPLLLSSVHQIEDGLTSVYDEDGQGDMRLHLWREAIEVGVKADLIGFGPGPHLTSKSYKRRPPAKFESHNTPLELFTQAGLAGSLAYLWLCGATTLRTLRTRQAALTSLIVALALFSLFHFVLRHPLFWFSLAICLLENPLAAREASRSGPSWPNRAAAANWRA